MSIIFNEEAKAFTLNTKSSTYQMQVGLYGHLLHLYYGEPLFENEFADHTINVNSGCFTTFVYESIKDRYQTRMIPHEFSCYGVGDFRTDCIRPVFGDGSQAVDLRYESYKIFKGKPSLTGLPATYFNDDEAESLEIILKDTATELRVA